MRVQGAQEGPPSYQVSSVCIQHGAAVNSVREKQVEAHGAEYFDSRAARDVGLTDRQHGLTITVNTRATPKSTIGVFAQHCVHAPSGQNEARMNQTIQRLRRYLYQFLLPFIQFAFRYVDIKNCV
jgi:hypothetical protein